MITIITFEVTSTTFAGQNYIYEEAPKVGNPLACIYSNDGMGAGSPGTGFFLNFVQGTLNTGTFTISQPSSNESIDIDAQNINNSDVWLYKLDSAGAPTEKWTQVPNVAGFNVIYNTSTNKNIYQVNTRAGDQIDLIFGDGSFANIPQGTFRLYYRQSNALTYKITPDVFIYLCRESIEPEIVEEFQEIIWDPFLDFGDQNDK